MARKSAPQSSVFDPPLAKPTLLEAIKQAKFTLPGRTGIFTFSLEKAMRAQGIDPSDCRRFILDDIAVMIHTAKKVVAVLSDSNSYVGVATLEHRPILPSATKKCTLKE